jgi:hypothetical protein
MQHQDHSHPHQFATSRILFNDKVKTPQKLLQMASRAVSKNYASVHVSHVCNFFNNM